jgi:lipid II:glycine glycyltransferase (peptidoglycan interpeptide bridge formation enzyme)
MRIIEFNKKEQKKEWNDFIVAHGGSFLQSWEWGEVMEADGRKIWRLAVQEGGGKILMAALVVKYDLPFGNSYLYIPRAPIFSVSFGEPSFWQEFLYKIKEIAAAENAIFLKIEPQIEAEALEGRNLLKISGFRKSRLNVQPWKTLILDLSKSAENLLEEMHPKTRYNIRLARKKGVVIRGWPGGSGAERFGIFWRLMRETAGRDKIRLFPESHYRHVFEILGQSDLCELYTAEYVAPEGVNEILASILAVRWGETATYLYGASASRYQNLMASSLIHWEAILDAKIKGLEHYDFWGIDEKKWPGITRFKKGFGGKEIEYVGAWDHAFRPGWCWIYRMAKRFKI